ncbi:MAG: Sec-independent protein translocase protein tatA/E-like protein [Firmicutes bacterium]|nr:Sec-independent protein translocase protein tatA/E-like protein [Bacillota bacterium]
MFSFSVAELGIILVLVLLVFGPGKLPDVGKALGRSIQEVRRAATGINSSALEKTEPIAIEAKTEEMKK